MSSFAGEKVLSELLGFAALYGLSWWKQTPELNLDTTSTNDSVIVKGVRKSTLWRMAVATSLVLFQLLLIGEDSNTRWVTPLITIGVFTLTRLSAEFDLTSPQSYTLLSPTNWEKPKLDVRDPTILPTISVLASILLLWQDFRSIRSITSAFLLLVSGVGFFATMIKVTKDSEEIAEKSTASNSQKFLRSTAAFGCGVSFLLLVLVASGMTKSYNILIILEVLLRAVQAFGLIKFSSEHTLATSSTITLSSIAAAILEDPYMIPGIRPMLAFIGAAAQVALTAPKSNDKRILMFGILFMPSLTLPILTDFSLAPSQLKEVVFDPLKNLPQTALAQTHPVDKLHKKWTKHFNDKLKGQSKNVQAAAIEYRRKYHREPPPGFDKWFEFAQLNSYLLPDEFDTLMASLEPFWQVSPADLAARVHNAAHTGEELAEVEVVNNKIGRMSWDHWHATTIAAYFEKFGHYGVIQDFNFTINALDEPRAVFDPIHAGGRPLVVPVVDVNGDRTGETIDKNNVTWVNIRQHPTYSAMAPSCPEGGKQKITDESAYQYTSHGIDFMDASSSKQSVCMSDSLREDHGFFIAPASMKLTHNVVPIFSQAAPQLYGDIVYPTPFYYNAVEGDIKDNLKDTPWESKINQTYWAGGSTGGYNVMENWRHIQRNRVSLMVNSKSTGPVTLLRRTKLGKWKQYSSWWGAISKYFNVHVTRLVQCEESACADMEATFALGEQPGSNSLNYKYILDMDGNSYTGRFYRLMHDNGAVIKSTIFKEWHDDLLFPWVHYIPLSNGALEFGEMMRFLISEPEGDAIGKSIGQKGKDWANRSLRKADMEVYAMRVFMEYGRLFDENRDTNYYIPDKN